MSTFLGLVKEIPGISVDRFDEGNLNSSTFFLSHCHSDHMIGLSYIFFRHLEKSNKYLYCSPVSKIILEGKYNESSHIKAIDINTPTMIEYQLECNDNIVITVTCVSAGHCPGSVMFLFEKNDLSVLYTGDFRINPKDFPKLKYLHHNEVSISSPKRFDKIYLDTTFLSPDFTHLPTRQESISVMCNIIKEWLSENPRNVVILECSALYGSEFLFMELSKSLNIRIHVKDTVYENYNLIVELSYHITNDPQSTPIHSCKNKFSHSGLMCRDDVTARNILTIIPSVMKWRGKDTSKVGEWDGTRGNTFNICYSTHCSFNELKAFLHYFSATDVYPSVCPERQEVEIYKLLQKITIQSDEEMCAIDKRYELNLPNCTIFNKSFKSKYFSDDDDSI